ncbi:MAG: hypothetical protein R3Y13_02360 [bacterium]
MSVEKYSEEMDKVILGNIKKKLYDYFYTNNLDANNYANRMELIEKLVVENSVEMGNARMSCRYSAKTIMLDKQFVDFDVNNKPVSIKKNISKLVESQLGHELLHSASRSNNISGIMNERRYVALNEGITQMITEDIFGYIVSPNTDSYYHYKKITKILRQTVGNDAIQKSYFEHTDDIENEINKYSSYDNFYNDLTDMTYSCFNIKMNGVTNNRRAINITHKKLLIQLSQRSIVLNLVIPKLKQLNDEEKERYLSNILDEINDDTTFSNFFCYTLKRYLKYTNEELENENAIINKSFDTIKSRINLTDNLYSESFKTSDNVVVNPDNTVSVKNSNLVEIKNPDILEKIYSNLYLEEKYSGRTEVFEKWVGTLCENLETRSTMKFPDTEDELTRIKALAAIKNHAPQNGYVITNSLNDAKNSSFKLNYVKLPEKNSSLKFNDVKKLFELYSANNNSLNDFTVKNRISKESVNDPKVENLAKFANVWASIAGSKRVNGESLPGITYAFNENSEKIFNEFNRLVELSIKKIGTIDTEYIYNQISLMKNKDSCQIIYSLLNNIELIKIINHVYRGGMDDALTEVELPKTTLEIVRGVDYTYHNKIQISDIIVLLDVDNINDSSNKHR